MVAFLLCGYTKSGRAQVTTVTTIVKRQAIDSSEITYSNPFDAPGKYTLFSFENLINSRYCYDCFHAGSCRILQIPRNGWIEEAAEPNDKLSPGETVNPLTTVNYKCLINYFIKGKTTNICIQGAWRNPIPDCQPTCSTKAITGVSIVATSCSLNDVEVDCSQPAQPGTIVRINCRDRYERQSGSRQQILICDDDGVWSPSPEVCSPICGEEAPEGTPYIVGGFSASINQVPWHAGIYKFTGTRYSLQCGGTIINARVIISAMHCKFLIFEMK